MKPTFLKYAKPLLCAMVQESTPEEMIRTICNALYDGAEAFGIQLENLLSEYRNEETLSRIFSYCEGKPIYITSYRGNKSKGLSDEECVELLLMGVRAGATLADVMGDLYHPEPIQMTYDPEAVAKQKALIEKIHEMGAEVLISSHFGRFLDEEETLRHAKAQRERGTDVVKIVNHSQNEEQQIKSFNIIYRLNQELDCPFLYLANGKKSKLVRQMGPAFGVCMYLCMDSYHLPQNSKEQPILRAMHTIRENMGGILPSRLD